MNFKENQTEQKLRGGYYTPLDLAAFLVRWINDIKPTRVLEPSCGDGAFFIEAAKRLQNVSVTGFELDSVEAKKAFRTGKDCGLENLSVRDEDFLGWAVSRLSDKSEKFDAVLGNPPFIRYQYLPSVFQDRAERIFGELDCKFTKHTNAWVPFILASIEMLRPSGRLAMVVPAEILHVAHAQSLRTYLGLQCRRVVIVDPEELWFEGTLQGAVLLMAEKKSEPSEAGDGLVIHPVRGRNFLNSDPASIFEGGTSINGKTVAGKWTRAILNKSTRDIIDDLENHSKIRKFKEIAKVDVGIVTGANKFFLVDDRTVDEFDLSKWAHPMFGRSEHCPGIIYDKAQHAANAVKGSPTNFVWLKGNDVEQNPKVRKYIRRGEGESLHTRYKCRIRKPWYTVPSVYSTEVGMLKRAHNAPRLILNRIQALTTDTAYRIRVLEGAADQLVYSFINPLTALSAELEGRHYGGGVLELVPSEIERLLMPILSIAEPEIEQLDHAIRNSSMDDVLEAQSRKILGGLGLSKSKQTDVLGGWHKLRNRRQRVSTDVA
ncbi:MAG TPA: SAM-dependent methyltransferase [Octadecabacter sp.]|nr:SAM-dependent methyltransferase [Octadecabacter sp.]